MKFNIITKLLIVATLPIITLTIFSLNYLTKEYSILQENKLDIVHLNIISASSSLIHELQIERGLSSSYLTNMNGNYFTQILQEQKLKTDATTHNFTNSINKLDKKTIPKETEIYLKTTKEILKHIAKIRKEIFNRTAHTDDSFKYFTHLNSKLIAIINSLQIYTTSRNINLDLSTLETLIKYQEVSGQERALVSSFVYTQSMKSDEIRHFYNLIASQKEIDIKLRLLLSNKNRELQKRLELIHHKYKNNFFNLVRKEITNYEIKKNLINEVFKTIGYGGMIHDFLRFKKTKDVNYLNSFKSKKIKFDALMEHYLSITREWSKEYQIALELQKSFDNSRTAEMKINKMNILSLYKKLDNMPIYIHAEEWFKYSTERINQFHEIEKLLQVQIHNSIQKNIDEITQALVSQAVITTFTIILLLFSMFYVANRIKYSILQLELGIFNFFDFLNFKIKKPKNIETNSNDEINDMAQNLNREMTIIDKNSEDDQDFINEATQIVMLMKDGDFSERIYFNPNNPHLIELKSVLNELMELISTKIKEQTTSLERLNASLEDKVYHQTLELHNQVNELTLARDKAIQAEIAKDEFLANMSHEIRTPLNAILGFVTILKKRIKKEKSVGYLNIIDSSGKSLLTIINDILDFSKIQSGKFTISPHDINPVDEFSDAVLLFASKAYEKHLVYAVFVDPNMPKIISVDAIRVKQILTNLLSNAIKFTPDDGEIKVLVTCNNSILTISIGDTGIGIEKKNQEKVFTAFEQADGSTTRKYGGTGLGLSISSKLASLMDGELTLKSEIGKGSTFTLTTPVKVVNSSHTHLLDIEKLNNFKFALLDTSNHLNTKTKLIKKYLSSLGLQNILELHEYQESGYDLLFFIPDDEYNEEIVESNIPAIAILRSSTIKLANLSHIQPLYTPFTPKSIVQAINESSVLDMQIESKIESANSEDEVQFKGSILVAEDNKTNQMLISLILDDYGIDFKIANNGLEAVDMFKEEKYDMVLMDENMPELNGIGAMKIIKEYEEKNSLTFTPIVALTASVLETDKDMFTNAGMDGFVGKPINTDELESEIAKYLKRI